MPNVTVIPAKINKLTAMPIDTAEKRRVAGYARVSTDYEEQQSSYAAQVDYYTNYITSREDWEFVGIYTDEGISATNTKKREGFKSMVADALDGKIDLIITKSVSRFARNTVDSLTTVRQLKDAGVEIYFEKENIWTLDAKGELLITIMSSLAQEESRSISENTTWGQRKKMADGRVTFAYSTFLGYEKDYSTGKLVINEEQAEVVRLIYSLFLEGRTEGLIAKELTRRGIKTPMGKDTWRASTVASILSNEKYKGDALMQKTVTVDFLQKKYKRNEGEAPQYYVEGNHPAIIDPKTFDLVQNEIEKRKTSKTRHFGKHLFSGKIRCADCGGWYGSKLWHSTDKYRRVVYRCNYKYKGEDKCLTPHVTEDEIKEAFVKAFNEFSEDKEEILANALIIKEIQCQTEPLEKEKEQIELDMGFLTQKIQDLVSENARVVQDQEDYQKKYNELVEQYTIMKGRQESLQNMIRDRSLKSVRFDEFIKCLKKQKCVIDSFDETLWSRMVEYVEVNRKKDEIRIMGRDRYYCVDKSMSIDNVWYT